MTHLPLTRPLSRRAALAGGAVGLLTVLAASVGDRSASAQPGPTTYCFFTDPHADPENVLQMTRLRATLEAIAADDPALVLHAGDVTEFGTVAEYEAYEAVIPATLRDRIEHVPGNHEIRWDVSAYENYESHVDQLNLEVTVGGVQFLLMDPTVLQQEMGYYTAADLTWLRDRLQVKPAHVPTIIVTHYPTAEGHYYVVNPEDLFATIEGRNVKVILAGHTHRQRLEHLNGLAHLEGAATKNAAQYYRLTTAPDGNHHTVLSLQHVLIPDPALPLAQRVTDLGMVSLDPAEGRDVLDPRQVSATPQGGTLQVAVGTARLPEGATARASLYSQRTYAGSVAEAWVPLTRSGNTFTGALDVSVLPAGVHRVNVEIVDGTRRWREVVTYVIEGSDFPLVWELDLGGIITGGLTRLGERIFAGSSAGAVTALDPGTGGHGRTWSTQVGPLFTSLVADGEIGLVVAGSANGAVTALRASDGSRVWQLDLGRPVMGDPLLTVIGGVGSVVVMAGDELVRIDAQTGALRWRRTLTGVSAGRPAADDDRIYVGLGDGKAWAVDAASGDPLWSRELANRAGSYRKLIYGPWTHQATLITEDLVLVSTVANGSALDRETGAIVWQIPRSFLYTPPRILPDGDLLLVDEWGEARRVDAHTGATRWLTPRMISRSLDAAPIVTDSEAVLIGTMGDLAVLDLATGSFAVKRQLGTSPVVSSPALAGGVVVVGHLDGVLRGYRR